MQSRRRFLELVALASASGLAGCNRTVGDAPEETPTTTGDSSDTAHDTSRNRTNRTTEGQSDAAGQQSDAAGRERGDTTTSQSAGVIDVREFGAAGDGGTDDTTAIQAALDAAVDGDTVYIPSGDYLVSTDASGSGPILRIPNGVRNLTIKGEPVGELVPGERPDAGTSRIFIERSEYERDDGNLAILRCELNSSPVRGLEIRDLRIDGNRPPEVTASGAQGSFGLHFWPSGAGGGHDILVEDVHVQRCSGNNLLVREGGVTLNRITSIAAGNQNFGLSEHDESSSDGEWGILLKNARSTDAVGAGIDHNEGGRVRVENLYSARNGAGGAKYTKDVQETWWVNCTFENEAEAGLRANIADSQDQGRQPILIHLDTVAARNIGGCGVYTTGDVLVDVPDDATVAARDCSPEQGHGEGGFSVHGKAGGQIDGDLVTVGTRKGVGVFYSGDRDLRIETLRHHGNDEGPTNDWQSDGSFSLRALIESDPDRLDTPTPSSVGAWSFLPGTAGAATGSESPRRDP